ASVIAAEDFARVEHVLGIAGAGVQRSTPAAVAPRAAESRLAGTVADQLEADLRAIVAQVLGLAVDQLTAESSLVELGLDSINLTTLVRQINERFGFADVDQITLLQHTTPGAMRDHLLAVHADAFASHYGGGHGSTVPQEQTQPRHAG